MFNQIGYTNIGCLCKTYIKKGGGGFLSLLPLLLDLTYGINKMDG